MIPSTEKKKLATGVLGAEINERVDLVGGNMDRELTTCEACGKDVWAYPRMTGCMRYECGCGHIGEY